MSGPSTHTIEYVSPSIVRCEACEFGLVYNDEQGKLIFAGLEVGHASGGMLYVPSVAEWDADIPARVGQAKVIRARLLAFLEREKFFTFAIPSLIDPKFFDRWPRERSYFRRRYAPPKTSGYLPGKLLRGSAINTSMPPPAVSMMQFDRQFHILVQGDPPETVIVRSDQTRRLRTRIDLQFHCVVHRTLPKIFDGLTVDDVTTEKHSDAILAVLEKYKAWRVYRLRDIAGADERIVAIMCFFGEDEGGPEDAPVFSPAPSPGIADSQP